MLYKTERFNAGFGISLSHPPVRNYIWGERKEALKVKAIMTVPGFGLFLGIYALKKESPKVGLRMAAFRGILYGSVVGIPLGILLDIAAMVTQVKAWIKVKRDESAVKARLLEEARALNQQVDN
ncbi:MAG: hypothetical protein ACK5MA_07080 [Parachlamydiaceae bacterium]